MKLAASTEVLVRTFGIDGAIRIFARAGFDALDWSFFDLWREDDIWRQDDWRETAAHIREICAEGELISGNNTAGVKLDFLKARGIDLLTDSGNNRINIENFKLALYGNGSTSAGGVRLA